MQKTGVFPVLSNKFEINTAASGATETYSAIANLETFGFKLDNGVEEWTPMEGEGWINRLMTSKSITIDFSGKRTMGDTGNDFVAEKFSANGIDANVSLKWTFPSGATLAISGVLDVTNIGGGDSTNVAPLEFSIKSSGKPTYTAAA